MFAACLLIFCWSYFVFAWLLCSSCFFVWRPFSSWFFCFALFALVFLLCSFCGALVALLFFEGFLANYDSIAWVILPFFRFSSSCVVFGFLFYPH